MTSVSSRELSIAEPYLSALETRLALSPIFIIYISYGVSAVCSGNPSVSDSTLSSVAIASGVLRMVTVPSI
jgi:hypothetical protein